MLGLPQALYYFIPRERGRARGILLENILVLGALGAVFSLFLFFGGNRLLAWRFNNPALIHTMLILALYPLFMLPTEALGACLMAQDRVRQVATYNVFSKLVALAVILIASFIWRTPAAAIGAAVCAAAVVLAPAIVLMMRATAGSGDAYSLAGMKSQMKFSVPLGLAGMVGGIAYSVDKVIVSSLCSPQDFAIYANGAVEIPLIAVVTGSITAVLLPELSGLFKNRQEMD
jgi:O-antigen/teichoic acid export membrane protein